MRKTDTKSSFDASENGLTTHCPQISACGVFLVNGDTLAQEGLDHVSNFKEIKKIMPLFKNAKPVDHRCDFDQFLKS